MYLHAGPEVCEPFLTLKSGSKRLLILLKTGKAILMSGFGGFGHSMYAGSVTRCFLGGISVII
jgi:hypothetical protein